MLGWRLAAPLVRASRRAGCLLSRSTVSLLPPRAAVSVNYSTHPSSKNGPHPQHWVTLDPELEEILVPRKMSISPLESWLTVQYLLPKNGGFINVHDKGGSQPAQQYDLPPPSRCADMEEKEEEEVGQGGELNQPKVECRNVLKIRRRKMNNHKHKKLMKRMKFLRRKILDKRRLRKQKKFEQELEKIWRRAGLKNPPEGWVTPNIYVRNLKS